MSYPETPTEEQPDPFDQLETGGEVAAFIYKQYGEPGLRQLLEQDGRPTEREWILDIAAELSAAGLMKAAAIASEIAATKPSMTDLSFCCYTQEPYASTPGNQANVSAWSRSQQRRQHDRELERQRRFK